MGVMIARRLTWTTVVLLCSLAGFLSFSPVALAVSPPVVEEEAVLDVAGTSATFRAKIDPEGNETTYRFEYGTSEAYGSSIPIPDGLVGSGSLGVMVSAHSQDLLPGTTYHYRALAIVPSRSETVQGSDGTFTTQPIDNEFVLADGRQWELVSPQNKRGALILSLGDLGPLQAAESGNAITYGTDVPTELEPAGYSLHEQVLSVRDAQGWSSRDIATPHGAATRLPRNPDYQFFSPDLMTGLVNPSGEDETLLSGEASEVTPYIRRESLCDSAATASECYLPLVTGKEDLADVPPGTKFGERYDEVNFEGASPDLSHVLLSSRVALTKVSTSSEGLYEWSADVPADEALRLVSLLPASEGGGPAAGFLGFGDYTGQPFSGSRHTVSDDGSRVFWEARPQGEPKLYMRDTVKGETIRLDVPQAGAPNDGSPEPKFQIASSDGSKVFFTDTQQLTAQSGSGKRETGDLYECDVVEEEGKLRCGLTDLTPESGGQSAEVQNIVAGASEDGSYVYFVANGAFAGSGATTQGSCTELAPSSTTCNLYVYHEGVVRFIAKLAADDEFAWGRAYTGSHNIGPLTARVSPDGRYLTFMSDMSLTGYDMRDANSGKPDQEVYLYDAQTKRLACVSCDPTGGRPVGVEVMNFEEIAGHEKPRLNLVAVLSGFGESYSGENFVAANLPPGNTISSFLETLYQPRALFDSGRLFFNSNDALVPQDVNGQEDVYEYEPEGTGSCTSSSSTFSQKTDGCVSLVSSGTSPEESGFMDASDDGGDVFFLTTSQLTSQDFDTGLDVYDAHECSASSACVVPLVSPPPCNTSDSCKTAPSPQPSVFGAPASSTFTGAGNATAAPSGAVVRAKSLTRAQKLAQALKACRKKLRRKALCERQARKRYAAQGTRRAAKSTSKGKG
jgi:hypothetical protein